MASAVEQILVVHGVKQRGWDEKSPYTVTFLLQEGATGVEIRARGVDPETAVKYISTHGDAE